jgi:citrate lyase gamma subunit
MLTKARNRMIEGAPVNVEDFGAVDFVMSANDTCTLMQISANLWLELARSNN